jgi:hypothetical protein
LNAIFDAHILVLMFVLLVDFSKPHGRKASFKKWNMITAAPIAVAPVHQHHLELLHVSIAYFLYKTAQLTRSRIVLAANTTSCGCFCSGFVTGNSLRKHSYIAAITNTIATQRIADDVIGEHRFKVQ